MTQNYSTRADGGKVLFTLPFTAWSSLAVTLDGVPTTAYTVTGNTVEFDTAPDGLLEFSAAVPSPGYSGVGPTPAEIDNLVSDEEHDVATSDIILTLSNAITAIGPKAGDLKFKVNNTGLADAGWVRASGIMSPVGMYDQFKFVAGHHVVASNCNNSTYIMQVVPNGAGVRFNLGTGATDSMAVHPNTGNVGAIVATDSFVYTFGGTTLGGSSLYNTIYRLNLNTNQYSQLVNLPAARAYSTAGERGDGKFCIVGGQTAAALTIANLSELMYVFDSVAGTVTPISLGFRSYGGRYLKLRYGAKAGMGLMVFQANTTTNGPSSGSTYVAAPRSFLIGLDNTVTEVDALTGVNFYEQADGKVVSVAANPSNSRLHDLTQAFGSQSTSYPIAAPTGLTLVLGPLQNSNVMTGGSLPFTDGTRTYLYNTATTPENSTQAFAQVKS